MHAIGFSGNGDGEIRTRGSLETRLRERERLLVLLRRFGADAVSFLSVESGMRYWFDEGSMGTDRACVAYVDSGRAWIAAGRPLVDASCVSHAAMAFLCSAKANGRSACFFATETSNIEGFASLLLGQQPLWRPAEWIAKRGQHRSLREQIRRAKAKGVRVRRIDAGELDRGSPLRSEVESLAKEWLASRHIAPMAFLVSVEPFHVPCDHRYYVAEWDGRIVEFLSAVPIHATRGWLVEDIVRSRRAPNGTTELLLDTMMCESRDSAFVTLGLAPLAGPVSYWLRCARFIFRPLYDCYGLHAFKQRLRPCLWQDVWLVFPNGECPTAHVVESLRAFAGGSLLAFALRSIARHPSAPPLVLALPLVPWIGLLAGLVAFGYSNESGVSRDVLIAWIGFDLLLAAQLFRSAARPRPARLAWTTAAAAVDAVWSVVHLAHSGWGTTVFRVALRSLAALAPCFGAALLAWATSQSIARSRS